MSILLQSSGRVPGYKSSDIQLLPSSTTKRQVWESMRPVSYSTFTSLWRQLLPHVVVMKPMSDLCWMCQKNSTAITRSANRPDGEKTLICKSMQTQHIHVTLGVTTYIHKQGRRKQFHTCTAILATPTICDHTHSFVCTYLMLQRYWVVLATPTIYARMYEENAQSRPHAGAFSIFIVTILYQKLGDREKVLA